MQPGCLQQQNAMEIYRLPVLSTNYIFLIHLPEEKIAAVVDPAAAEPVLEQLDQLQATLVAILNTHHHTDHIGGNRQLLQRFPGIPVYGGAEDRGRIPGQHVFLREGDRVTLGQRVAEVLFVPGHTKAHIAYYFPPLQPLQPDCPGELFCGDTLFAGGCGRLFEGSPAQMLSSLSKLRALPDETRVWCAHEYTLNNLQFAMGVDKQNPDLQARLAQVKAARDRNEATIPSTIGLEKRTNPFLRWDQPALQTAMNSHLPTQTFARLRELKDRF